jgi:hypothetical protein
MRHFGVYINQHLSLSLSLPYSMHIVMPTQDAGSVWSPGEYVTLDGRASSCGAGGVTSNEGARPGVVRHLVTLLPA